ncbi:hypothetical protein AQPE_3418 [Aquipluma nitroreducens]|uniref:Uncharacterized protein n=1 Tax=Aquipluma nitroreducens TaxID=2010828 RepID=A0A5K7SCC5_9BACT|nr:hypothetical protein AQPE_3418 [Aquipluma nitroreducens]
MVLLKMWKRSLATPVVGAKMEKGGQTHLWLGSKNEMLINHT